MTHESSETPAASPRRGGPVPWLWSLVPAIVAVVAYLWVLDGWFLYDDFTQGYLLRHDAPGIAGNWGPILRDFGRAQFGIEEWVYYRAMMSVYLTACLELFGVDPFRLHAVNVCHHAAVTFMVATLCAIYCRSWPRLAAICGGCWFAVHPVTVEAIAWFSANTVTFELLPRLGSMLAFALHLRSGNKLPLVLSVLLACLALVTKESAINLPVALVALHFLSEPRPGLRAMIVKHLPFVPVWIGYFLLRYLALGTFVAGSHAGATSFFEAIPVNGPLQARAVFLPFGDPLPGLPWTVCGALLLAWAFLRGVTSRAGLLVLLTGAAWLFSQFAPTALNLVFDNLGGSRAHYGTLASATLWLAMLVFGKGRSRAGWLGAAVFAAGTLAFFPVRNARQEAFEEAWSINRKIHAEITSYGQAASAAAPVAILQTPYDHKGVPQLNRTAHFTLGEVPFQPHDLPILGLTSIFDPGAFGDLMLGDVSPLRAVRELGGTLLLWNVERQSFDVLGGAAPQPLPQLARSGPLSFAFSDRVSPYDMEELVLSVQGAAAGGTLSWGGAAQIAFGAGVADGDRTVFRIDLTHHRSLLVQDLLGGIRTLSFTLEPQGASDARLDVLPRLPELALARRFEGASIPYGEEERLIVAPALPRPGLEMRIVVLAPNEPIAFRVTPGAPIEFPRALAITGGMAQSLRGELKRILRLSRQKRFYYYFEAVSPEGRALGGARSRVDWFRLEPTGDR